VKQSRTYSLQIIAVLFIVFDLAGCSPPTNEPLSPTENPAVSVPTPEIQQTETPLLSQLMAEPVEITMNPKGIGSENVDDLTFLTRFGDFSDTLIWSPDNTKFAIGYDIYDAKTFALLKSLDSSAYEYLIEDKEVLQFDSYPSFSPDGKTMVIRTTRPEIGFLLIDANTFEVKGLISIPLKKKYTVSFSADGSQFFGVTATHLGTNMKFLISFIYDLNTEQITYLSEEDIQTNLLIMSPDAAYVIEPPSGFPPILWDTASGEKITSLKGIDSPALIIFSPNSKYIAATDQDNVVIWDTSGKIIVTIEWHSIESIAITPDNSMIAVTSSQGNIDFFDIPSGDLVKTMDTDFMDQNIAFSPDGSIMSVSTQMNGIAFWTTDSDTITSIAENRQPDLEIKENFTSLPPGDYILFSDGVGMSVISPDGTFQKEISSSQRGIPISVDGRILSTMNYAFTNDFSGYINLITGETQKMGSLGVISPDLKWVADTDFCDPDIYQWGMQGYSTRANTTFCTYVDNLKWIETDKAHEGITRITWSPDATKLAFVKITWPKPDYLSKDWPLLLSNGLHIMDASCFNNPRTCDQKTNLATFYPFKIPCSSTLTLYLNWSPDGTYVVLNTGDMLVVSDLKHETVWKLEKTPVYLEDDYQYFGISPDNKYIAYSGDRTNIVMQPLTGGDEIEIASGMEKVQVLGWIMAPLLQTGETFKVLPDGNHTRIRKFPNLELDQIGALYTNNTFTVLDGPVQEDGYTWWYIHSDVDDTEGWVPEFYEWYEKVE
jgi:WD40 repeat protein